MVKFCNWTIVSVGWSKDDQTGLLWLLRSTRLPESSIEAKTTPRPSVPESQTVVLEPLIRRNEPEGKRRRDPRESTVPADHTGTFPAKDTAARNGPEEDDERKETEKLELGDDQDWFEPVA